MKKESFAPIPNIVMERIDLLAGSKLCYGRLLQYQGTGKTAYPSISTLAKNLGVGRRQIMNYLKELEEHNLLTVEKRPGMRNHYVLNSSPVNSSSPVQSNSLVNSSSPTSTFQFTTPVNSSSPSTKEKREKNNKKNNENIKKNIKRKFSKPTIEEIKNYCNERKNNIDPERFHDFYESKGWKVGNSSMRNWKAAVRTWERNSQQSNITVVESKPIQEFGGIYEN